MLRIDSMTTFSQLGFIPYAISGMACVLTPTKLTRTRRSVVSHTPSFSDFALQLCHVSNATDDNASDIPTNTHTWKTPAQVNPGFMCAREVDTKFTAKLGSKGGVPAATYEFKIMTLSHDKGSYSTLMWRTCKRIGMLPICDFAKYCKQDTFHSLYLGQSRHISFPKERDAINFHANGWSAIKDKFEGKCFYTGFMTNDPDKALCNIPGSSHSWKLASQANPGFICGRRLTKVSPSTTTPPPPPSPTSSPPPPPSPTSSPPPPPPPLQSSGCRASSLPQIQGASWEPQPKSDGTFATSTQVTLVCPQGANAKPPHAAAFCMNGKFYGNALKAKCVGRPPPPPVSPPPPAQPHVHAHFGAFNGIPSREYEFVVAKLPKKPQSQEWESYSESMIEACQKVGMKPLCDHPNYCKTDPYSLYLGQLGHLSYPEDRNRPSMGSRAANPPGFDAIKDKLKGLCMYAISLA